MADRGTRKKNGPGTKGKENEGMMEGGILRRMEVEKRREAGLGESDAGRRQRGSGEGLWLNEAREGKMRSRTDIRP